jgi:hypothetical protein
VPPAIISFFVWLLQATIRPDTGEIGNGGVVVVAVVVMHTIETCKFAKHCAEVHVLPVRQLLLAID